jgi:hypothetical protein
MAGLCGETVVRFEKGKEVRRKTIAAIQSALKVAGVVFIAETGGAAGVRLHLPESGD